MSKEATIARRRRNAKKVIERLKLLQDGWQRYYAGNDSSPPTLSPWEIRELIDLLERK